MNLYDHPSAMEPMFPSESAELNRLAHELGQASARLGGCVHPVTGSGVATLVRSMNSYYSNLIEGHNTHPVDIERALKKDFASDPAQRALQVESAAHIEVQGLLEARLCERPTADICAAETLCCIHEQFYQRLPESFRQVKTKSGNTDWVIPGELRKAEVEVGSHIAPKAAAVASLLSRFSEVYAPSSLEPVQRIIAAAASHHRLAWIHPFLEGNGRVGRLFTQSYLTQAGLDSHGLWAISRGLARRKVEYLTTLAAADVPRRNDLDGRGNLSNSGLTAFCKFFLECSLDQVRFMTGLLDFDRMLERIRFFAERWARGKKNGRFDWDPIAAGVPAR